MDPVDSDPDSDPDPQHCFHDVLLFLIVQKTVIKEEKNLLNVLQYVTKVFRICICIIEINKNF